MSHGAIDRDEWASTRVALIATKVEGGLVNDPDRGFGVHGLDIVG